MNSTKIIIFLLNLIVFVLSKKGPIVINTWGMDSATKKGIFFINFFLHLKLANTIEQLNNLLLLLFLLIS